MMPAAGFAASMDHAWLVHPTAQRVSAVGDDKVPSARAVGANDTTTGPERGGLVLSSLILVAAVAKLNLSVANVALPSIGQAFDSSQTTLNLIAVGYSLGLAASVLYLGAVGDRYGRKLLLVLGVVLSVLMVAALILAINFAPVPNKGALVLGLAVVAVAAGIAFLIRQRRAPNRCTTSTSPAVGSSGWRPAPGSSCSAR
jgi:MFS family permease